jgi:hypothetical protein
MSAGSAKASALACRSSAVTAMAAPFVSRPGAIILPSVCGISKSSLSAGHGFAYRPRASSDRNRFRGVAEYYRLAFGRHRLGRLRYVMERSLAKTLARKYRISVPQAYRRYRAVLDTGHGPAGAFRSRWTGTGNRRWSRNGEAFPWHGTPHHGHSATTPPASGATAPRSSSGCWPASASYAGRGKQVEVYHIRALKDLNRKGEGHPPEWVTRMAARRRKTVVVCRACHEGVHSGSPHGNHDEHWRAEMLGKRASPVRREAVRKGPIWHLAGGPPHVTHGFCGGLGGEIALGYPTISGDLTGESRLR